jgi:hypothetical protein
MNLRLRRAHTLVGLWLAISGAVVLAPGCYGRNCQGDAQTFGAEPGQGHMLDDNTWESTDQRDPWLPFPRQRQYVFDLRALGGRTPAIVWPYISAAPDPWENGNNFAPGGGNLSEILNPSAGHVEVKNDTCSDYYLRLVVWAPPAPPVEPLDGGNVTSPADASVADAADAGDASIP